MKYVKKLMHFEEGLFEKVSEVTARAKAVSQVPELKAARDFVWFYGSGSIPKEEMETFNDMIRKEGREKAEAWRESRRAAYAAEVERVRGVLEGLRPKGFERTTPNESQTICLLLRWALKNAPAEVLQVPQEDLRDMVPRTPPMGEPKPKKATKAKTSRR